MQGTACAHSGALNNPRKQQESRLSADFRPMTGKPGLLQREVGSLEPHRELAIVRNLGNDLVAAGFHEGAER